MKDILNLHSSPLLETHPQGPELVPEVALNSPEAEKILEPALQVDVEAIDMDMRSVPPVMYSRLSEEHLTSMKSKKLH